MSFETNQISEVMLNTCVSTLYHEYLLRKITRFKGEAMSPTSIWREPISLQYTQSPLENELVQLLNLSPQLWLQLAKHEECFISIMQNIEQSIKLRPSTRLLLQNCINYVLNPNGRLNYHEESRWLSLMLDESMDEIPAARELFQNPCKDTEQNTVPLLKELALAKALWCRVSSYLATILSEDASSRFATTTQYAASARITALFINEIKSGP